MTVLGGKDVLRLMQGAGFTGDDAKLAAAVAHAASKWHDHYEAIVPGSPSADRFGLFALSREQLGSIPQSQWFSATAQAARAFTLWIDNGRSWWWNDAARAQGGAFVRASNHDILTGNLFARPTVNTYTIREDT